MDFPQWIERAQAVSDAGLAAFRRRICVARGHIGIASIGTCGRCGGMTSSGSMALCEDCGRELGACQHDGRKTGWGPASSGAAKEDAAFWLALLMRGYSYEREAAERALPTFELPGLAAAARDAPEIAPSRRSPVAAELIVGFQEEVPAAVGAGGSFLDAPIVSLDAALRSAVVLPSDARQFERDAAMDARVAYVELNRQIAELGAGDSGP